LGSDSKGGTMSTKYQSPETTPTLKWTRQERGLWVARHANGTVYVERTRDGWAYGTVSETGEREMHGDTTRPIGRNQVLAERLVV